MKLLGKMTIPFKFPSLNDIIRESKKHWAAYSKMKGQYTEIVKIHSLTIKDADGKICLDITWHEPFKSRRDPDNVMAGVKFILDGLVEAEVIHDDNKDYVYQIHQRVIYSGNKTYVTVHVMELEEGEET